MVHRGAGQGRAWYAVALVLGVLLSGCSGQRQPVSATPGGGGTPSDAATAQAVEQRIRSEAAMAGSAVKAGVQNGTVTLEGSVKSMAQKDRAEQMVRDVQRERHQQEGVLDSLLVQEGSGASQEHSGGGR